MANSETRPQESAEPQPLAASQTPVVVVTNVNDSTGSAMVPSTAAISATALVEILSTVASSLTTGGGEGTGSPQLQLQVQLTSQGPVVGLTQEVTDATVAASVAAADGEEGAKQSSSGGSKGRMKQPWHYHLGGVRHCRVPLAPEIKEALEVAYVSRIMSKNFRKEGQPEKERIAQLTGLEIDKVQEWFKNRRKKDKLIQSRVNCHGTPKGKRGRKLLLPQTVKRSCASSNNTDSCPSFSSNSQQTQMAEP